MKKKTLARPQYRSHKTSTICQKENIFEEDSHFRKITQFNQYALRQSIATQNLQQLSDQNQNSTFSCIHKTVGIFEQKVSPWVEIQTQEKYNSLWSHELPKINRSNIKKWIGKKCQTSKQQEQDFELERIDSRSTTKAQRKSQFTKNPSEKCQAVYLNVLQDDFTFPKHSLNKVKISLMETKQKNVLRAKNLNQNIPKQMLDVKNQLIKLEKDIQTNASYPCKKNPSNVRLKPSFKKNHQNKEKISINPYHYESNNPLTRLLYQKFLKTLTRSNKRF